MEKYSKNRHLTQRFLFYLSLALIFILTSVIYEARVLQNRDPEKVFLDFQEEFSDAEKFLSSSLQKLSAEKYINDDVLTDEYILSSLSDRIDIFFFKYLQ